MSRQPTLLLLLATLTPALPMAARAQTAAHAPSPQFPVTLAPAADAAAAATAEKEPGWSPSEIAEGQARCTAVIARNRAEARVLPPIHDGICGTPVPIEVTRVGPVTLSHPAIINCNLLGTLNAWLQGDVQPAARRHLGGPVVRIDVMSSYSCRNAYGRKRTHLSEHALANAIDIGGFRTTGGAQAVVLADWGMTEREIKRKIVAAEAAAKRMQQAKAEAQARAETDTSAKAPEARLAHAPRKNADDTVTGSTATADAAAQAQAQTLAPTPTLKGLIAETFGKAAFRSMGQGDTGSAAFGLNQPSKLGGPKTRHVEHDAATAATAGGATAGGPAVPGVSATQRTAFLHEIHGLACKRFGTVLGPEANYDHRNHFHLDLAVRAHVPHICE